MGQDTRRLNHEHPQLTGRSRTEAVPLRRDKATTPHFALVPICLRLPAVQGWMTTHPGSRSTQDTRPDHELIEDAAQNPVTGIRTPELNNGHLPGRLGPADRC